VATLQVSVVSPEREVFTGRADMVVARGREGDVGILPGHAPMLVELAVAPVRIREGGRDRHRILVDGGFLHVTPGEEETRVDILAEHAALPEEIDASAARARAEQLQRRAEEEGDTEVQVELAKALMRAEHGRR
jgi:F-type H+-transporting ATPase subunit epsilon